MRALARPRPSVDRSHACNRALTVFEDGMGTISQVGDFVGRPWKLWRPCRRARCQNSTRERTAVARSPKLPRASRTGSASETMFSDCVRMRSKRGCTRAIGFRSVAASRAHSAAMFRMLESESDLFTSCKSLVLQRAFSLVKRDDSYDCVSFTSENHSEAPTIYTR
jgi:hypothetical protein